MGEKASVEHIVLPLGMNIPYRYRAGSYVGKFLEELRDNERIYANKCPKCGRFHLPPRIMCGRCHVRMGEWVELGHKGTVLVFGVTQKTFIDPETGKFRKVPYTEATIQVDGAPVTFEHWLEETNPEKLYIGMRVEAVFKPREQRIGDMRDILHWKTTQE